MLTKIVASAVLSACVLSVGSAVLSHSITSNPKREIPSSSKQEMIVSQVPGFRLMTTYNRGKNTFASLGIKNKLYIDNTFSELEGYIVATAWAEYHLAVNAPKVRTCMAKYSTKTTNDSKKDVVPSRAGIKYLPETTSLPFVVYIRRVDEKSNLLGFASKDSTGGNKLEITLNAHPIQVGNNRTTYKKTAGVIGHELLHVYGFNHPKVIAKNFSPVLGNAVYESGWCISRDGTDKNPTQLGLSDDGSVSDEFVD
jgi:hypothetical protein